MTHPKIRIVSTNNALSLQPKGDKKSTSGCVTAVEARQFTPGADEALRLIHAFRQIRDAAQRQALIAAAEAMARK